MPLPSCEEYRDSQQLLALKIRLSKNRLDPEERKEIERLIQELEKKSENVRQKNLGEQGINLETNPFAGINGDL